MYCIKCGREVPAGVKICQSCAEQSEQPKPEATIALDDVAQNDIKIEEEVAETVSTTQKKKNKLMIPFILVCALLIGVSVFTVYSYGKISVQKANYRAKEASLSSREKELSSLQTDYDTVCAELEAAETTISEQSATISSLEDEISTLEGSASQSEYDITEMQKTIETLTTTNEELTAANATLTTDKANLAYELELKATEITSLEGQLSTMTSNYNTAQSKVDFMNTYVVFVNNNGSNTYHKYDCSSFTKANFWAYSTKLAENYGYTPCSNCCG